MKVLPGFKRGSGLSPFVVVDTVEGRATMVLETEIGLAVLEVALDAREMGLLRRNEFGVFGLVNIADALWLAAVDLSESLDSCFGV
jgi:hypothetical protein